MKNLYQRICGNYCKHGEIPLGSYAGLVGLYNLLLGALLWRVSRRDASGAEPRADAIDFKDLLMLGVSTHKLSRVITKDAVTAPFRAPFTSYKEDLGYGEVNETARGKGIQEAVGELLTCNYCADMWVGLGFLAAYKAFPRQTRTLMSLFSSVALADFMHVHYERARTDENVLTLRERQMEKKAS